MLTNLADEHHQDYGKIIFQGVVVENNDPQKLERVKVQVQGLYDAPAAKLPWCLPYKDRLFGSKPGQGVFAVPSVGARVHVILQQGSTEHPMYCGSLLLPNAKHPVFETNYPNRYGWIDPAGNVFYVDTTAGSVEVKFVHKSGATFHIADDGAISVATPSTMGLHSDGAMSISTSSTMSVSSAGAMTINSGDSITLTAPRIDWNP